MAETVRPPDDALIVWEPRSKPQAALIACPVFEVFFGGSRGSLKTDSMLGDWINHSSLYGVDAIGLMVRRTLTELSETYERAKAVFCPLGFEFLERDHIAKSPDGSRLRFAYLDRDSDAEKYQGHSYTRVYAEEIGNFPNEAPIKKLMATLRSAKGVPCGFRATGNPGGPGHQWVKARYIDANPKGWEVRQFEFINPWTKEKIIRDRVFIPGRITDHNLLGDEYIANLMMSGSEELVRAWLEGDWDAIVGTYFDCWYAWKKLNGIIRPCVLPDHWLRFRSFDWGSARPFSVGWWAVASEGFIHPDGFIIPKGAMVRYREWYGASEPNVGLKMTAEAIGAGIVSRDAKDPKIIYGVADPSAFSEDGGPSHVERMFNGANKAIEEAVAAGRPKPRNKVIWRRADNKRVADKGHLGGWDMMRARFIGEDDCPMIYCFSTCTDSIRTIPALQHDKNRAEDVDTEAEDHAADEWRYACMSRPYTRPKPVEPEDIKGMEGLTLNRLWKESRRTGPSKRI